MPRHGRPGFQGSFLQLASLLSITSPSPHGHCWGVVQSCGDSTSDACPLPMPSHTLLPSLRTFPPPLCSPPPGTFPPGKDRPEPNHVRICEATGPLTSSQRQGYQPRLPWSSKALCSYLFSLPFLPLEYHYWSLSVCHIECKLCKPGNESAFSSLCDQCLAALLPDAVPSIVVS